MIPLRDTVPRRKTPVITWSIIIVNLVILLYQNFLLTAEGYSLFLLEYGFIPHRLTIFFYHFSEIELLSNEGAFFLKSLLTSQFLHGSWMHLIGNMWMLWLFGDNIEDYIGHIPYLIFYLISGLAASMLHYVFNISSPIPAIGASGAVAGIMGAYFILYPRARVITLIPLLWIPLFLPIPAVLYIGVWFIGQFWNAINDLFGPSQNSGVAFWAHVGGFLFGLLAIQLWRGRRINY